MTKDRPRNRPKSRGETGISHPRPHAAGKGGPFEKRGSPSEAFGRNTGAAAATGGERAGEQPAQKSPKPWTRKHAPFKPGARNRPSHGHPSERRASFEEDGEVWLWGLHAVAAALKNRDRVISTALLTRNAAQRLAIDIDQPPAFVTFLEPGEIDRRLPVDAVHQGAALRAQPLNSGEIDEWVMRPERPLVILDQVTDPQNVGAIFRSAAAFGFAAVVLQTRNAPALGGALAKAATGAIETVSEIRTVNISRAIDALTDAGWNVVGLAGEAETALADAFDGQRPIAIVLGAEGAGIRQGVASACSRLARIPMAPDMESLNVSNAAAIAFYEAARRR